MQKQQLPPLLSLPLNIAIILDVTKKVQDPRIKTLFSKKREFLHLHYIFLISLLTCGKK